MSAQWRKCTDESTRVAQSEYDARIREDGAVQRRGRREAKTRIAWRRLVACSSPRNRRRSLRIVKQPLELMEEKRDIICTINIRVWLLLPQSKMSRPRGLRRTLIVRDESIKIHASYGRIRIVISRLENCANICLLEAHCNQPWENLC